MRRRIVVCAVVVLLTSAMQADMKLKTRSNMGGQAIESTVYVKGARQRTETSAGFGPNIITIYQCDQRRMIQVNPQANTCMVTPLDEVDVSEAEPQTKQPATSKQRKGGVITFTTNVTDTGERKQILGFNARRIKASMRAEASANACEKPNSRIETDGWYADFPGVDIGCATGGRAQVRGLPQKQECEDTVRFRSTGSAKMGYPLILETTVSAGASPFTFKQETVDLSRATLDTKLFDMPANCKQVSSYQELVGAPGNMDMKAIMEQARRQSESQQEGMEAEDGEEDPDDSAAAGRLRVAIARVAAPANMPTADQQLRDPLARELQQAGFDVVRLQASSQQEALAEAKARGASYVVFADAAAVKESAARKLGGMLGRATGMGDVKGKLQGSVSFRVLAADARQVTQLSATGQGAGADEFFTNVAEQQSDAIANAIRTDQQRQK